MAIKRGRRAAGGFLSDFREFALKGNVVDLAIAVIIGGAFGKIVTSFVEDVIMPLLNPVLAQAGSDWRAATIGPGIKIGSFFGSIVDFILVALVLFLAIRALERTRHRIGFEDEPEPKPTPDADVQIQERLADSLDRLTTAMNSRGI